MPAPLATSTQAGLKITSTPSSADAYGTDTSTARLQLSGRTLSSTSSWEAFATARGIQGANTAQGISNPCFLLLVTEWQNITADTNLRVGFAGASAALTISPLNMKLPIIGEEISNGQNKMHQGI